jgi:RNA polymerase sigma-70 factor, ECF subfamily
MIDVRDTLATYRPDLLRHCYRMLGSFADAEDIVQDVLLSAWKAHASYAGDAPVDHWLMRIATNACLNELGRRRRRGLPQLDYAPAEGLPVMEERPAAEWVTPAPDSQLFGAPAQLLEARESVALAFLALLQRLPPRQRAVLLLKDVVGWKAEEIATALELSLGSVNSALHRARETIAMPPVGPTSDPPPDIVRAYIRSWEDHDVESLVALLRHDVTFSMPPHSTWFRGVEAVERFLRAPPFATRWLEGFRIVATRANGTIAFGFYRRIDAVYRPSSLQVVSAVEGKLVEIVSFIGADYFRGFGLPVDAPAR